MASEKDHHDHDIIESYVERLLAIDGEREQSLNEDDLRRVARELGLSERDLGRLDEVVADHLTRGRNFLERELFTDAASELHQALVLRPFDASLTAELAHVHYKEFERTGEKNERERALRFARRAIELDAEHAAAYELLRRDRDIQNMRNTGRGSTRTALMAFGLIAAVAVAGAVWLGSSGTESPVSAQLPEPPGPGQELVDTPAAETNRAVTSAHAQPERDVPLTVMEANTQGLTVRVERSRLRDFGQSFSYNLDGTIEVSGSELGLMRGRLELLASDGRAVVNKDLVLHDEYKPDLRPGDAAPFHHLIHEKNPPPDIASARLHIDLADRSPAAATYSEGALVELEWPGDRPAHIDLEVRERSSEVRDALGEKGHWLVIGFTNRGQRPVEGLRVQVELFAADDSPLGESLTYLIPSSGPALPAGQTWVRRIITKLATQSTTQGTTQTGPVDVPEDARDLRYRMRVVSAE